MTTAVNRYKLCEMSSISENNDPNNFKQSSMWWLKNTVRTVKAQNPQINIPTQPVITSPNKQLEIEISSSIDEYLEKEDDASEADIGSIIEEINKLASQSPIGVYDTSATDKSVEEIMQEAEKLYLESSKSFEQLSSKSRSSIDYSLSKSSSISFRSKKSTPSPKSSHSVVKLTQEFEKLDVITDDRQSEQDEIESVELNNNDNDKSDVNDNDQIYELDFEKDDSEKEFLDNQDNLDEQGNKNDIVLHLDEVPHKNVPDTEIMEESPDPEPDIPEEDIEELQQEVEALKHPSEIINHLRQSGFVKAQSDNLPGIDPFMMSSYSLSNPNFTSTEVKRVNNAK